MASPFICPKGHPSADNDFCSECGAKIQNGSAAPSIGATSSGRLCPDCGAPVPASGVNFCEICGYNFAARTSGQFGPITPSAPPPQTVNAAEAASFRLIVTVDATLRNSTSPDAPTDTEPIIYAIDKPVSLIGRKSEARAIYPEIALDGDSAVSHRHGIISQTPDGSLTYRDLESSNGTRLNGTDLAPLVDTPLKTGDELTLGHWSRIALKSN